MDITRLPVAPLARPTPASTNSSRQPAAADAPARAGATAGRPRARDPLERVVEGELLHRQVTSGQSTRAFIDERSRDQARPADQQGASLWQSRYAVARYINHVRPEPVSELTQGRSVNLFV